MTTSGKLLTIMYGFIGIPLMFLAAVDLGRFLSEVVLKFYVKAEVVYCYYLIKQVCLASPEKTCKIFWMST